MYTHVDMYLHTFNEHIIKMYVSKLFNCDRYDKMEEVCDHQLEDFIIMKDCKSHLFCIFSNVNAWNKQNNTTFKLYWNLSSGIIPSTFSKIFIIPTNTVR